MFTHNFLKLLKLSYCLDCLEFLNIYIHIITLFVIHVLNWNFCDVLPGNVSVICGFWIYYSDLLVIHKAELQLIITLSVFHIRPVF
jgi:hypothetical protein